MTWIVDDVSELAAFLQKKGLVYGPVGEEQISFEKIGDGRSMNLSRLSDVSARHLFQPLTQYFLRFEDEPDTEIAFTDYEDSPRVLMGLRPCDIRALVVHDKVFDESSSYRKFRESATIVGLLCAKREKTCFCDSLGGDPHSREGMDLALYISSDGGYILQAVSEKGERTMDGASFRKITDAPEPSFTEADHVDVDVNGLVEALGGLYDSDIWEQIGFACVNCRVCTYLCPTCHCFTVTDEVFKSQGARATVWDSCQNKLFTKEASGHNPRGPKWTRVRQRILHKFYYYPKVFGDFMCSGCGRCISGCPTGRNIAQELTLLREVKGS